MAAAQTEAQYAMLGLQIQIGRFAAPAVAKANIALADIVRSFRDGRPRATSSRAPSTSSASTSSPSAAGCWRRRLPEGPPQAAARRGAGYVAYRLKLLKLISIAPLAYGKGLIAGRALPPSASSAARDRRRPRSGSSASAAASGLDRPGRRRVIIAIGDRARRRWRERRPAAVPAPPAAGGKHDTIPSQQARHRQHRSTPSRTSASTRAG
jgi:hypothetical protein